MRNDDVRMVLGAMQDFRENRINNKRWAEKQILDQAMREREEERYADQKELAEAMAARDEKRLNLQRLRGEAQDRFAQLAHELNVRKHDERDNGSFNYERDPETGELIAISGSMKSFLNNGDSIRGSAATQTGASSASGTNLNTFTPGPTATRTPAGIAPTAIDKVNAHRTAPNTGGMGPLAEPIDSGLMPNPAVTGIPTLPNMHTPTATTADAEAKGMGFWSSLGSGIKEFGKNFINNQPLVMGIDNYAKAAKEAPAKHKAQRAQRKAARDERTKNWSPQMRSAVTAGQMTPAQADAQAEELALRKLAEQFDTQAQH